MHDPTPDSAPEATDRGMRAAGAELPPPRRARPPGGLLSGMRIRKKLIFLHTAFSLSLAVILLVALRPTITEVVERAEINEARLALKLEIARRAETIPDGQAAIDSGAVVREGAQEQIGLGADAATEAKASPGQPVAAYLDGRVPSAAAFLPGPEGTAGTFISATVRIPEARSAVVKLYVLVIVALLAVYALVAAALELFVLPQHVYGPIGRVLDADEALQEGRRSDELIAESVIPADELGEIMRSRKPSRSSNAWRPISSGRTTCSRPPGATSPTRTASRASA